MLSGHQRITWRNRLSRVHERYRQTTDGRKTTYSEHEHEFTFAKNYVNSAWQFVKFRGSYSGLAWSCDTDGHIKTILGGPWRFLDSGRGRSAKDKLKKHRQEKPVLTCEEAEIDRLCASLRSSRSSASVIFQIIMDNNNSICVAP